MSGIFNMVTTVLDTLLGGGEKAAAPTPAPPPVTPPTPMPTPGDADATAARRKSIAEQLRRQGRASTILTDTTETDKLGA